MRPPTDHTSSSDGASDDHLPGETRRLATIGVGGNPSYEAPRMPTRSPATPARASCTKSIPPPVKMRC